MLVFKRSDDGSGIGPAGISQILALRSALTASSTMGSATRTPTRMHPGTSDNGVRELLFS